MWSAATRRRFPNRAATSRRTPQTHPSGLTMTKAGFLNRIGPFAFLPDEEENLC